MQLWPGFLLTLLAGCAAAPGVSHRPLGGPAPALRATGEANDVLDLAGALAVLERHGEALDTLEAALAAGQEDAVLRLCRVDLLRDLGRRAEAAAAMREVLGSLGAHQLHPGLLLAWAELEWLEHATGRARDLVADLWRHHATDPWLLENRTRVAALQLELDHPTVHRALPVRDLLGDLRGGTDPEQRLGAFTVLQDMDPEVRARAAAIAAVDPDPALRVAAVQAVELPPDALAELCAQALRDPAPAVRAAAASRAAELDTRTAADLLLAAMQDERSESTFAVLHAALARALGPGPSAQPGAAATAAGRRALLETWRQRWPK
jgi:tetratricopeptide (TPR) repeat protein